MKLMRVGEAGAERPVVGTAEQWFDASGVTRDFDADFFATGGIERLGSALASGELPPTAIDGERIGAPILRPPSVLCIGMNFAAHAAESGALPPEELVIFFKKSNTVVGPNDPIRRVDVKSTLDWEVELGIVVGAPLHGEVTPHAAMAAIAGYVLADDVSDRWLQLDRSGGQWSKGKCFPGSCALGPWIATADEIEDPQKLDMRSWVNGEPRQASNTSDLVFSVAQIMIELARVMTLEPGDVILTGTPQGVALSGRFPYLASGDRVRMTIDGLGEIEQSVEPFPVKEIA